MFEHPSRRQVLKAGAALACVPFAGRLSAASARADGAGDKARYQVAACDWMMLKRQKLGAFQLAKDCDMDGVEVDMGSLGSTGQDIKNELRKDEVRKQFLDKAKELGLGIPSMAMSAFYAQSYAEHPKADDYTAEMIELMPKMGAKVGFLPLGVRGDLVKHPELRPGIVARLKKAAPLAEKQGVVIGLETAYDSAGNVKLLDDVGSKAVQIYFNPSNAYDLKKDLFDEIGLLGKDRICQFHFSDKDGEWLENGRIDVPKVKKFLDDMGWGGWLVIERSRKPGKSVRENFSANAKYLKKVFQA